MAFRRRDSRNGYSSADAYRSLRNPADGLDFHDSATSPPIHSSSDEDNVIAGEVPPSPFSPDYTQVTERTALTSGAPTRGNSGSRPAASAADSDHEGTPLSPPRPFFLGDTRRGSSDRTSWSSAATLEPASDSDVPSLDESSLSQNSTRGVASTRRPSVGTNAPGAAGTRRTSNGGTPITGGSSKAARAAQRYANLNRERSNSASTAATTSSVVPPPPSAVVRPRSHQRRRSTLDNVASAPIPDVAPNDVVNTSGNDGVKPDDEPNPFDTPTSSVYAPSGANVTPPTPISLSNEASNYKASKPSVLRKQSSPKQSQPIPVPQSPVSPTAALTGSKPPPSAFPPFPFQSHPGNPDPGTPIPGLPRRSSLESFRNIASRPVSAGSGNFNQGVYAAIPAGESQVELERPNAAYMQEEEGAQMREGSATPPLPPPGTGNVSGVYRNSAAAAMASSGQLAGNGASIPRNSSFPSLMRAPFLSPASRPTSTVWSPPAYPTDPYSSGFPNPNTVYPPGSSPPSLSYLPTGTGSNPYLPRKTKPPLPSSRLIQKLTNEEKPWLSEKDGRSRASWWLTLACFILGVGASAVVCYFGWTGVRFLKDEDLCLVMSDDFSGGSLNTDFWNTDVELGGFGNGEFQMTTDSSDNLFIQNGQLYIAPTLTSDEIGKDAIFNGHKYTLSDCSVQNNGSACSVTSNGAGQVINPIKSARINTKGKKTITYGKVEVKAKNPRGDWLWPAIWMLPQDNKYGSWPLSGEIDIMEARGNGPEYSAQGSNFVRSTLNYGPAATLQTHMFGWWTNKHATFDKEFHTYSLEWTPDWMRFYVDSRLQAMINMKINGKGGKSFFEAGNYPDTAKNGSDTDVAVRNIWEDQGGSRAAPFDQAFYLIIDLAAGGTSGWFPDGVGGKPWLDTSQTPMYDFAFHQDDWSSTWPSDVNDRAFRIDSVKMWSLGKCSS